MLLSRLKKHYMLLLQLRVNIQYFNYKKEQARLLLHLYLVTKQWRKIAICSLAKSAPTHDRSPPPKTMKSLELPPTGSAVFCAHMHMNSKLCCACRQQLGSERHVSVFLSKSKYSKMSIFLSLARKM